MPYGEILWQKAVDRSKEKLLQSPVGDKIARIILFGSQDQDHLWV